MDGLCNLYAWLFWSNQRAKNKWKPQIGSLCTTMWMSDQNRKCMKLFFLKVHLRRLNLYIWRHIFADPMSRNDFSIVMDWTKMFEGTFLQTPMSRNDFFHWSGLNQNVWRYIYAYTMDSHSAMQWSSGELNFEVVAWLFSLSMMNSNIILRYFFAKWSPNTI